MFAMGREKSTKKKENTQATNEIATPLLLEGHKNCREKKNIY